MTSRSISALNLGDYSNLMKKGETGPETGIAEVPMITHRVLQITNKFRHSSIQITEYIASR